MKGAKNMKKIMNQLFHTVSNPLSILVLFAVILVFALVAFQRPAHGAAAVIQLRPVSAQDIPGQLMIGVNYPQWIDPVVLAAGVAQTYTVPTGALYILFSANADFYARYDGTAAAVPTVTTTSGSGPELNPGLRNITGATTISLISPTVCIVTLSVYK